MRTWFIAYGFAALSFLALDAVWLSTMVGRFYRPKLGSLLAAEPRLGAAAAFYLLYTAAVVTLVVMPALRAADGRQALALGALFGAAAYGTYDLTNMATLKDWPLSLTLVDLAWGTVLTAASAYASWRLTGWVAG